MLENCKNINKMAQMNQINDRFSMFYADIDSQLSFIANSESYLSENSRQKNKSQISDDLNISNMDIDNLLDYAKEFEDELKSYVKSNNLKKKAATKLINEVKKPPSMTSVFPPIWNDEKLSSYIQEVLNDLVIEKPQEVIKCQIEPQKKSLKDVNSKVKRNVGVNVKFKIDQTKDIEKKPPSVVSSKHSLKKAYTFNEKHPDITFENPNHTLFPCRVERVQHEDATVNVGKELKNTVKNTRTRNTDGSIDVNFKTKFHLSPQKPKVKKQIAPQKPQRPTKVLKYSPLTVTSTSGIDISKSKQIINEDDEVVSVVSNILATNKHVIPKQTMAIQVLPVLSIKGECRIQSVYQLEIVPGYQVNSNETNLEPRCHNKNIMYAEFVYTPIDLPKSLPVSSSLSLNPIDNPPQLKLDKPPSDNEIELNSSRNFIDARDLGKLLSDYGVHLKDGKINVVYDAGGCVWGGNKRNTKKTKSRKSFKPLRLRKYIEEIPLNDNQKINIKDNETGCEAVEAISNEHDNKDVVSNPSELSSSITDDHKIREILKITKDDKIEGGEKSQKYHSLSSDESIYPSETNVDEEKEVITEYNQAQKPFDMDKYLVEDFQSIYKLIEDTFQPTLNTQSTNLIQSTNPNEKDVERGVVDMRRIIKMSEENIKKAGKMLEKYHNPHHTSLNNDKIIAIPERFGNFPTNQPQTSSTTADNDGAIKKMLSVVVTNQLVKVDGNTQTITATVTNDFICAPAYHHQTVQTDNELVDCHNYKAFSNGLETTVVKKIETAESGNQTTDDKTVQTDGNNNWKSQYYFGNVYDKYSNYNHIKFHPTPPTRHNPFCSSKEQSCNCIGCERKKLRVSRLTPLPVPAKRTLFTVNSPVKASMYSSVSSLSTPPKISAPYNSMYSDDDEIMQAANKFLRSVEKRKNRNADSDFSSSERSSIESNKFKKFSKSSSSYSTPSHHSSEKLLQRSYPYEGLPNQPPLLALRTKYLKPKNNKLELASIEQALEGLKPFESSEPLIQFDSPILSSSPDTTSSSPEINAIDAPESSEIENSLAYLSDGEVLSQGEIQLDYLIENL